MTLNTFPDYLAVWCVLFTVAAFSYIGYCVWQRGEVDKDVPQGILWGSFWVVAVLWAVRRLWF